MAPPCCLQVLGPSARNFHPESDESERLCRPTRKMRDNTEPASSLPCCMAAVLPKQGWEKHSGLDLSTCAKTRIHLC